MPWTCTACGREDVGDTLACPSCGNKKTAWTVSDQTRVLQIPRARRDKFALFVGAGTEPGPPDAPEQTARSETPAESAWSLPRGTALDLARRGLRPAPAHQLTVRVWCKANTDLKLHSEILFAAAQPAEQEIATEPASSPETDVRFVFVHGPGDPVSFEGLHVIDVSEDDGHAASVKLSALNKKARELSLQPVPAAAVEKARLHGWVWFERRFHGHGFQDKPDPIVSTFRLSSIGVRATRTSGGLEVGSQHTNPDGCFDFGEVPHGDYTLEVTVHERRERHELTLPLAAADSKGHGIRVKKIPPSPGAENLAAAHQVLPLVNEKIQHFNKPDEGLLNWLPGPWLANIRGLDADVKALDREIEHPDDETPPTIQAPADDYTTTRKWARIARQRGIGNCGEKAAYAAVLLSGRGLHPVEVFRLKDGDHSFCVVGRDPDSPIDSPTAWGRDSVVCDPWLNEAYPARDAVEYLKQFKAKGETRPCPPLIINNLVVF